MDLGTIWYKIERFMGVAEVHVSNIFVSGTGFLCLLPES